MSRRASRLTPRTSQSGAPASAGPPAPDSVRSGVGPVQVDARTAAGSPYLIPWLLLFAGSGCAALIYEIVWFQLLAIRHRLVGRIAGLAAGGLHGRLMFG